MKFFTAEETLSPSPDFELAVEDGSPFFVHKSGMKVRTDEWGKAAWESAPGTPGAILAGMIRIAGKQGKDGAPAGHMPQEKREKDARLFEHMTEELGEEFSFLLYRAGILTSPSAREPSPEPPPLEDAARKDQISAVVVTYNGMEHIRDCFASLERQTCAPAEIIAVDNASGDGTVETLHRDFPRVKVFPLVKNLQYARAVNYGLKQARGKFVLVLNQDVELDPCCIARLHRKAAASPGAGAVVPMMKFFHLRGFVNGIGNHIRNSGWGSDNFIGCVDIGQFELLEEIPSACFGAVLLRREAVKSIGYLDGKYGAFYEDTDWSFRCWMKGWPILPAVKAVVYHKFGASYPGRHKLKLAARNRMRLVLKIFRGRIMAGFLRRYWKEDVKNTLALIRKARFGEAGAYAGAYASLLLQIPDILAEKRKFYRENAPALRERDVLAKNPAFFSCLDESGRPVIDWRFLIGYYHPEFARIRARQKIR